MDILQQLKDYGIKEINKTARLMSFMVTTKQVYNKSKTVTRRLGWDNLRAGDMLWAAEKCQGLGKGGEVKRIWYILILKTNWEPLHFIKNYGHDECVKEGFPELSPEQFVEMFCELNKAKGCMPDTLVNRIEFTYPMYKGSALIHIVPDEDHEAGYVDLALLGTEHDKAYAHNAALAKKLGMSNASRRRYCYRMGGSNELAIG